MSELETMAGLPIFWTSATHRGSIRRLDGTTADGKDHDLGIWVDTVEIRTKRGHTVPYDSIEIALARLAEMYPDFRVVNEVDVVAAFMADR